MSERNEISAGAVDAMREWAKRGLGFNCTFVDDDMRVVVGLAQRAVLAGLATDFSPDMQRRFTEAAEEFRADHEASLGRPIIKGEITEGEEGADMTDHFPTPWEEPTTETLLRQLDDISRGIAELVAEHNRVVRERDGLRKALEAAADFIKDQDAGGAAWIAARDALAKASS